MHTVDISEMAQKDQAAQIRSANLSFAQTKNAIPKLQRRIDELASLRPESLSGKEGDNALEACVSKINATLRDIYGLETIEYQEYQISYLNAYNTGRYLETAEYRTRMPYIKENILSAISRLMVALDLLKEQIQDADATNVDRVVRAYEGLELHTEIARAASKLFSDGHYANAVEAAVKALNGLVRLRSGLEQDGVSPMEQAFSPKSPVLKFNPLADTSDKDEQKGFMQMFCGAVSGLRNPRAHGFINDDPERALEFIAFVSLLAKLLDQAQR